MPGDAGIGQMLAASAPLLPVTPDGLNGLACFFGAEL